jgi:hypothetical protein
MAAQDPESSSGMKLKAETHFRNISIGVTFSKKHFSISLLIITIHILFNGEGPDTEKTRKVE